MTRARTLHSNGELHKAISTVAEELMQDPADLGKRAFYVELLCMRGDYDKAARHLEGILSAAAGADPALAKWRRLIDAARLRRSVFKGSRTPGWIGAPTDTIRRQLDILRAVRGGDFQRAAALIEALDAARNLGPMRANGEPIDELRDLDDTCAGILEVFVADGRYLWIDLGQIRRLEFAQETRPLDSLWRPATLRLTDGSEHEAVVPAVYPTATDDEAMLLGRRTDWLEMAAGVARGIGKRLWLVGEEALSLGDIRTLEREAGASTTGCR